MLIGTGDVRTWLGLNDSDRTPNAKILSLCSAIQAFVESYTNRKLEAQRFTTHPDHCYLDGTGKPWIYLPIYPIWNIYEVAVDNDREFGSGTLIGMDDIIFDPQGKVMSEAGYFTRGRRNVRFDYYAGYGAGSYPLPADIKQVMVEMIVETYKSGLTAIHQVQTPQGEVFFLKLLSNNTMWKECLGRYTRMGGFDYSYDDH